jgi:hypothetical protein
LQVFLASRGMCTSTSLAEHPHLKSPPTALQMPTPSPSTSPFPAYDSSKNLYANLSPSEQQLRERSQARVRTNIAHYLHSIAGSSFRGLESGMHEFDSMLEKAKQDLTALGRTEINLDSAIIDNYLLCEDNLITCGPAIIEQKAS